MICCADSGAVCRDFGCRRFPVCSRRALRVSMIALKCRQLLFISALDLETAFAVLSVSGRFSLVSIRNRYLGLGIIRYIKQNLVTTRNTAIHDTAIDKLGLPPVYRCSLWFHASKKFVALLSFL